MSDTSIGLHLYAVKLHYNRKKDTVKLSQNGDGASLADYCPVFFNHYSQDVGGEASSTRSWYLEPAEQVGASYHGIVRYGTTGFSEEIRDRPTRQVQYNRKPTDIGTIPLYYRFWVPDKGNFGLLGLQTFGSRSCVERFKTAFNKGFRENYPKMGLFFRPIMPTEIAKIGDGKVKTFSLTKRNYSSDKADNQIGGQDDLVDLDVTFKAKPRGSLGPLSSIAENIKSIGKSKVLEYNDTHFDEATAEVMIGKRKRKIVLVGINRNAGKIDLSDDVITIGGHPKFDSIATECENLFSSIVSG